MIPKIIHYIWLGRAEKPKIFYKCLESWKKFCPDYQIIEWNESNLNIGICQFCKDAYNDKKYAFASDVLRFDILNNYGGIYLDIDVELIRPLDNLLSYQCFMGFETESVVAPGLILGAENNHKFLKDMLNYYKNLNYKESVYEKKETVCTITSDYLKKIGFVMNNKNQSVEGISLFSSDYFCPVNIYTNKTKISEKTISIHHYSSSWYSKKNKILKKIKNCLNFLTFGYAGKKYYAIKNRRKSKYE